MNGRRLMIGLAALAAVPLLYIAAYVALLEPKLAHTGVGPQGQMWGEFTQKIPAYRFGGEAAEWFFAPIHGLDQKVRQGFWAEQFEAVRPLT